MWALGEAQKPEVERPGALGQPARSLCDSGGRLATQLRGLYERGVFAVTFDTNALRDEMQRQRLDAGRMIIDARPTLSDADIPVVLKLLDKKRYTGWHTATRWDVATRTRRSI